MSTVGDERQHQAARHLIAQMVKNSDLFGADAAEEERIAGGPQDEYDDERSLDQQAFDSQRDSEFASADDRASGGRSGSATGGHKDQVQAAFENYGQITEEILAEWKEMFSLFESVRPRGRTGGRREVAHHARANQGKGGKRSNARICSRIQSNSGKSVSLSVSLLLPLSFSLSLSLPVCRRSPSFDNTGFIKTDDLGTVLRGLGRNLTESIIGTLINSYDANGSGKVDFPTFYRLMTAESPMPGPCHEAQVLLDFHVFDMHRDGFIPVVDLVHLLRNLGEPLTRDDVDCLLAELYIDGDNRVNIEDCVRHMFTTSAPNPE